MTLLLVVMLAGLWGAVFLPALLRARQTTSPIVSVSSFRHGMRVLGQRSSGRWIVLPQAPEDFEAARHRTIAKRRRVFTFLIGVSALTLLVAIISRSRGVFAFHLAVDVALGGYIYFLLKNRPSPARAKQVLDDEPQYLQAGHF